MDSLWRSSTGLPRFPHQEGPLSVDVLIIGGGMAGLLTAYYLKQDGVNCVLAEQGRILSCTTGNTTAKITAQHGLCYHKIRNFRGTEMARLYWEANQNALETYAKLCKTIPCNFTRKDNYVYSLHDFRLIEQELDALQDAHIPASFSAHLPLPLHTAGAVRFPQQAQFDPVQFAAGICKGLPILENTCVREFTGTAVRTNRGMIRAKKIVVATHFPFWNKHGSYFLKLYQHRSYVLGLENVPNLDGMYVDENSKGLSFRSEGNYLLLGGGGHRTGKQGGGWEELRRFAEVHYPDSPERFHWAAQDCMSLDNIPYVGPYSARTPNLFVATGFNKWGMTGSMAAALLLRDLVQERENPYAVLYSPSRSILRPQLFLNSAESALNLLTPTVPRCPHLGCALKWNKAEHTWDCPCHGSRFEEEGTLLEGPATGDLEP